MNDERLDKIVSVVLRTGVILAAALVLVGGIAFLASSRSAGSRLPEVPRRSPRRSPASAEFVHGATHLDPLYMIQLGLLMLIATPVVRVITCVAGFALERDWMYAVVSLIVLAFLLASITILACNQITG